METKIIKINDAIISVRTDAPKTKGCGIKALFKVVVVDWKGVVDEKGYHIECTEENKEVFARYNHELVYDILKEAGYMSGHRFDEAQVGDEVNCLAMGDGVINIINDTAYPIIARFINGSEITYTLDGFLSRDHKYPLLFFRKGEQRNLTERPRPETDWTKVPRGTRVRVWDDAHNKDLRQFYAYEPAMDNPFIVMGISGILSGFKNAELI
jgi:hypothetical protein